MTSLREDVVLIEHSDPGARQARMSTNTYAVLRAGRALLMDTTFSPLVPFIRSLAERGFAPAGLVLSHRHVAAGDVVRALADEFDIPVLLHPRDAQHPQALFAQVPFQDPIGHPLLETFGLEAIHFPGHTSGHIVLYGAEGGGTLFTGDAAMGTTAGQAESGIEYLIRPPVGTSVDDGELRNQWIAFNRPVATVLPYHGNGYVDRPADIRRIMATLTREQRTVGLS
jgi:glyoxylase-like metal-dependent hydrolase (beta-lactamase superfamily II)